MKVGLLTWLNDVTNMKVIQSACIRQSLPANGSIVQYKKVCFIWRSIQPVGPFKALYNFGPPPSRPVHSGTDSASPGSILATQQLRVKTKSLGFEPGFTWLRVRQSTALRIYLNGKQCIVMSSQRQPGVSVQAMAATL